MKIIDKLNRGDKIRISFEVFPPKTDAGVDKVMEATDRIAALKPSYISVTPAAARARTRRGLPTTSRAIWAWKALRT